MSAKLYYQIITRKSIKASKSPKLTIKLYVQFISRKNRESFKVVLSIDW